MIVPQVCLVFPDYSVYLSLVFPVSDVDRYLMLWCFVVYVLGSLICFCLFVAILIKPHCSDGQMRLPEPLRLSSPLVRQKVHLPEASWNSVLSSDTCCAKQCIAHKSIHPEQPNCHGVGFFACVLNKVFYSACVNLCTHNSHIHNCVLNCSVVLWVSDNSGCPKWV